MNEAKETLRRYFSQTSNTVHFHGDGVLINKLASVLTDDCCEEYDAPDVYIKNENEVWIIEHFEFDCYKANRKGSSYKREENRVNNNEKKIVPTEEGVYFGDTINADSSYADYVGNVLKGFNNHYKKIEDYKQNLINDGVADEKTTFIVIFLIDDVSPLGTSYIDKEAIWRPIILAHCREFLQVLKNAKLVDGVLAVSSASEQKLIWFIDRNQIDEYLMNSEDYSECRFVDLKPHVVGFKVAIPDSAISPKE